MILPFLTCNLTSSSMIDEYGKYLAFWPTLNFHVYVTLF